jgi:hypothetical protein
VGIFGGATVVGDEEDEGIVVDVQLLELLDEPADLVIHARDLRGVDAHSQGPLLALLGGELVPWFLYAAVHGGHGGALRNDAQLDHAAVTVGADSLPASVVFAFVFLDVF